MPALWPDIPGLNDRIAPGEEVPLGECPECQSLCRVLSTEEVEQFLNDEKPPQVTCPDCGNSDIAEFYVLQNVVELHNLVVGFSRRIYIDGAPEDITYEDGELHCRVCGKVMPFPSDLEYM
jgi:hypothetical protein